MISFLHKLFSPHCEHCLLEQQDKLHCNTCEVLQHELELLRLERDRLLSKLLDPPVIQEAKSSESFKPIQTGRMPWAVRKQMLESESREAAKLLGRKEIELKTTDELEKEILEAKE